MRLIAQQLLFAQSSHFVRFACRFTPLYGNGNQTFSTFPGKCCIIDLNLYSCAPDSVQPATTSVYIYSTWMFGILRYVTLGTGVAFGPETDWIERTV